MVEMENQDPEKGETQNIDLEQGKDLQTPATETSPTAKENYADGGGLDRREFEALEETPTSTFPHFVCHINIFQLLQITCLVLGAAFILSIVVSDTTVRLKAPPVPPQESNARVEVWDGWRKLEHHFIFGDSYSDQAFDPYSTQPSEHNPFGNPDWLLPLSSGSNWVHFVGVQYNRSLVKTYSLAVGGSIVDPEIVTPYANYTPASFDAQLHTKYLPIYAESHFETWNPRTSLFSVFFGINDIALTCFGQKRAPVAHVLHSYRQYLEVLYTSGARNFLLLNVPPFYRNIMTFPGRDGDALVSDTFAWNEQLALLRDSFTKAHRDVTVFLFDTWKLYADVLADQSRFPQTAWLKNTTSWCPSYSKGTITLDQLDPDCEVAVNEYFWLNEMHPTYPIHDATAARIVSDCFGRIRVGYCS